MDKDEIDRFVKETKVKNATEEQEEDVNMEEEAEDDEEDEQPKPTRSSSTREKTAAEEEEERREAEADREQAEEDAKEEASSATSGPSPTWATRYIPGSIIHCNDAASNEDPVDSTARVIDLMIVTHIKARYRMFFVYMVNAPAKTYVELVNNSGNLPEYDTYIPYVGDDEHGELREPTTEEHKAAFQKNAKNSLLGGRDIEMYLRGIEGNKIFCKIMKYLIQTGITPEFIAKKLSDVADADDEDKPDIRREVTNFVRKMIAGAFAVKSYDYFRVTHPNREDHIHMDPVSLACAVVERARTFAVLYTINKIGLGMPPSLTKIWETKLKSTQSSLPQLEKNINLLDPSD
eukprot:s618_g19.t1